MTSPESVTSGASGMMGVPSCASNASGAPATSESFTLAPVLARQVLHDAPRLQVRLPVGLHDEAVRRPPHRRRGDVADLQVVRAAVERQDDRAQRRVLVFFLRVLRLARVVLQREGRRPHAAAALLHHGERRQEVADLGLPHLEAHLVALDVPARSKYATPLR